jgi:hypothetical protein
MMTRRRRSMEALKNESIKNFIPIFDERHFGHIISHPGIFSIP